MHQCLLLVGDCCLAAGTIFGEEACSPLASGPPPPMHRADHFRVGRRESQNADLLRFFLNIRPLDLQYACLALSEMQ